MDAPSVIELKPEQQAIVAALLTHPRLVNLKRQFQDEVDELLSNEHALVRLAETLNVSRDELSLRGSQLVALLSSTAAPASPAAVREVADVVSAFCLSAALLSFWGHFTATLSKLTTDDVFINDVAMCCSQGSVDDVRAAIRDFGDLKRMPAGKAGM